MVQRGTERSKRAHAVRSRALCARISEHRRELRGDVPHHRILRPGIVPGSTVRRSGFWHPMAVAGFGDLRAGRQLVLDAGSGPRAGREYFYERENLMNVDIALLQRESDRNPIRVGMVGAGATGRAIALQLGTPVPGIRLVAIANRTPEHGERAFREGGFQEWRRVTSARAAEAAISHGIPVLTDDPSVLTTCPAIDILLEVTGTVEAAAGVVLQAFRHGKHVVLVNAELDSLVGPILKARADSAGVVVTHTDGDEPGVAMTLLRYLKSLGLHPVAAGNIKGMVDYYRNPETQRPFAEKNDQDVRKVTSFADATKLSMETTVLANATGFHAGRRGMYGPACKHVREMAELLPANQMLSTGLVDYALRAEPYTGAFVIGHEQSRLKNI